MPSRPSSARPGIGLPKGRRWGCPAPGPACARRPAHHVLPAAGLGVHFLPRQADHVDEQSLGEPMLAHHRDRQRAALLGEFEVPVTGHVQQTVALHPRDGLADGRSTLLETLGDAGLQRNHALFLEVVDRPQVHLGGIDQIVHRSPFVRARVTCLAGRTAGQHRVQRAVCPPETSGWRHPWSSAVNAFSWRRTAGGRRARHCAASTSPALDLPDPLAREPEQLADLVEGGGPSSSPKRSRITCCSRSSSVASTCRMSVCSSSRSPHFGRHRLGVLDEVTQRGFLVAADRHVQAHRVPAVLEKVVDLLHRDA